MSISYHADDALRMRTHEAEKHDGVPAKELVMPPHSSKHRVFA